MAQPWEADPIVGDDAPWAADPIEPSQAGPAKRRVGEAEMAGRMGLAKTWELGELLSRAFVAPVAAPTKAIDWIAEKLTGKDLGLTTRFSDPLMAYGPHQFRIAQERLALQPGEEPITRQVAGVEIPTGKIGGALGSFVPMLLEILATKRISSPIPMAPGARMAWQSAAPVASRVIPEASAGAAYMTPAAIQTGMATQEQLIRQGVDPTTATAVGATRGLSMMAGGAVPAAAPGALGTRLTSGVGFNVLQGSGQDVAEQMLLRDRPELQPSITDPTARTVDVLTGLLFSAMGPRGARFQSPEQVRALRGTEPAAPGSPWSRLDRLPETIDVRPETVQYGDLPAIPRVDEVDPALVAARVAGGLPEPAVRPLPALPPVGEPARVPVLGDMRPIEQPPEVPREAPPLPAIEGAPVQRGRFGAVEPVSDIEQLVREAAGRALSRQEPQPLPRIYPAEPARAPMIGDRTPVEEPIAGALPPPAARVVRPTGETMVTPRGGVEALPESQGFTPRDELGRVPIFGLNREAGGRDAGQVRGDEGPIPGRGPEPGRGPGEGGADLQRAAQAGRGAGDRAALPDGRDVGAGGEAPVRRGPARPLERIQVKVKAIEAETGREVTMTERADVALKDVDDNLSLLRALRECLES